MSERKVYLRKQKIQYCCKVNGKQRTLSPRKADAIELHKALSLICCFLLCQVS